MGYKKINIRHDCLKTIYPFYTYKPKHYNDHHIRRSDQKLRSRYWAERRLLSLIKQGIIVPTIKDLEEKV